MSRRVPATPRGLIEVRFTEDEIGSIDAWIEQDGAGLSRPAAIRQLVSGAIESSARPRMARVPVIDRHAPKPHMLKANADEG